MSIRTILYIAVVVFLAQSSVRADQKPNFLLIMLDDSGWTDFGSYGSKIQTPNIDKLWAEGIKFTDCHAPAPNCSPTRAGFLTGRMPSRIGVYSYIPPGHPMHLRSEEITIAEVLKKKGYHTGHFGKWHLSQLEDPKQPHPNDQGFDHSLGTTNNAQPSHLNPVNFVRNKKKVGKVEGYSCQIVADEFTSWMKKVPEKEPFLGVVWFHEPHSKIASPENLVLHYMRQGYKKKQAKYFANIHNVDLAVGKILKQLEQSGRSENTFLFLTSDNGGVNAFSNQGLRGKKSFVYEGGHREPGLLRWPGKIKTGWTSEATVSHLDLFPTICEIVGAQLPEGRKYDGVSLLSHITKGTPLKREKPLFWFFYRVKPSAALRVGDWKLVGYLEDPKHKHTHPLTAPDMPFIKSAKLVRFELYNLKKDRAETQDVKEKNPEQFEAMKKQMISLHQEVVSEGPTWDLKGWRR